MDAALPRTHVVEIGIAGMTALHLFGGPYVVECGRRITVPEGSKRLLVFVALHQGRIDRRHAAGTLWPVGGDERAAGNLRSALWRLKGAGIELIEADKHSIQLRHDTMVDVQVLRAWSGRILTNSTEPGDLRLPTWSPDDVELLPGWYDDWIIFERERTRQRIMHAMETLSRRLAKLGRHADAVEAALYAVRVDPLRESAQSALVEVHVSEGNLTEARLAFAAYSDLLRDELGVTPGREITRLVQIQSPTRAVGKANTSLPSPVA